MAKAERLDLESLAPLLTEEDEEALAAIDEAVRDADAARTVSSEEVRKQMTQWISASSTPKER